MNKLLIEITSYQGFFPKLPKQNGKYGYKITDFIASNPYESSCIYKTAKLALKSGLDFIFKINRVNKDNVTIEENKNSIKIYELMKF